MTGETTRQETKILVTKKQQQRRPEKNVAIGLKDWVGICVLYVGVQGFIGLTALSANTLFQQFNSTT